MPRPQVNTLSLPIPSDGNSDAALNKRRLLEQTRPKRKPAPKATAQQSQGRDADFRVIVEQHKQELDNLLLEKTKYILQQNSHLRASFISAISTSIIVPVLDDESPQQPLDRKFRLHQAVASLIDGSEQLLQRYDKIRQGLLDIKEPSYPGKEWADDCGKLYNLFDMEESRTKQQLNNLLSKRAPSSGAEKSGDTKFSNPEDIWTLFAEDGGTAKKKTTEGVEEKAWAEIARRAERDVRRLMRHIEQG